MVGAAHQSGWTTLTPDPSPSVAASSAFEEDELMDDDEQTSVAARKRKPSSDAIDRDGSPGTSFTPKKSRLASDSGKGTSTQAISAEPSVSAESPHILPVSRPPPFDGDVSRSQKQVARKRPPQKKPTKLIIEPVNAFPSQRSPPATQPQQRPEGDSSPSSAEQTHLLNHAVRPRPLTASPVKPLAGSIPASTRIAIAGSPRRPHILTASAKPHRAPPAPQPVASPSKHLDIPSRTAKVGQGQESASVSRLSAPRPSSLSTPRRQHQSPSASQPVASTSRRPTSPVASSSRLANTPLEIAKRRQSDDARMSTSSSDMPDTMEIIRKFEKVHSVSPVKVIPNKNAHNRDGPGDFLPGKKKKKINRQHVPVPQLLSNSTGTQARRKSKASEADVIEISSDDDPPPSQRPPLSQSRSHRRSSPYDPPSDVISITSSEDERRANARVKQVLRYDADGSILIDDEDEVDAAADASSQNMLAQTDSVHAASAKSDVHAQDRLAPTGDFPDDQPEDVDQPGLWEDAEPTEDVPVPENPADRSGVISTDRVDAPAPETAAPQNDPPLAVVSTDILPAVRAAEAQGEKMQKLPVNLVDSPEPPQMDHGDSILPEIAAQSSLGSDVSKHDHYEGKATVAEGAISIPFVNAMYEGGLRAVNATPNRVIAEEEQVDDVVGAPHVLCDEPDSFDELDYLNRSPSVVSEVGPEATTTIEGPMQELNLNRKSSEQRNVIADENGSPAAPATAEEHVASTSLNTLDADLAKSADSQLQISSEIQESAEQPPTVDVVEQLALQMATAVEAESLHVLITPVVDTIRSIPLDQGAKGETTPSITTISLAVEDKAPDGRPVGSPVSPTLFHASRHVRHRSLYGGREGFFKDVYRQRRGSQLSTTSHRGSPSLVPSSSSKGKERAMSSRDAPLPPPEHNESFEDIVTNVGTPAPQLTGLPVSAVSEDDTDGSNLELMYPESSSNSEAPLSASPDITSPVNSAGIQDIVMFEASESSTQEIGDAPSSVPMDSSRLPGPVEGEPAIIEYEPTLRNEQYPLIRFDTVEHQDDALAPSRKEVSTSLNSLDYKGNAIHTGLRDARNAGLPLLSPGTSLVEVLNSLPSLPKKQATSSHEKLKPQGTHRPESTAKQQPVQQPEIIDLTLDTDGEDTILPKEVPVAQIGETSVPAPDLGLLHAAPPSNTSAGAMTIVDRREMQECPRAEIKPSGNVDGTSTSQMTKVEEMVIDINAETSLQAPHPPASFAESTSASPEDAQIARPDASLDEHDDDEEQQTVSYLRDAEDEIPGPQSSTALFLTRRVLRSSTTSRSTSVAQQLRRSSRRSASTASSSLGLPDPTQDPNLPLIEPRVASPDNQHDTSNDEQSLLALVAEKCGLKEMTWENARERLRKEYADVYARASEIPHELQDRINALPLYARRAGNMQVQIFEAAIVENTADDEPEAPHIRIINDIDDELTPPYEFHYSNLMWHGEGVPKPDWENLQGCACDGPCDPFSKTCSCAIRQRQYTKEAIGFQYDAKKRLRSPDYPIFECNDMCGCSDACRNRVVQQGRKCAIDIRKTEKKGWGVFAGPKKIPSNTYVGIYAGEYLTDAEAEERGRLYNHFGRTYLFDLDFWHLHQGSEDWENLYSVDAFHAGNFTRYLNHSCDPNCKIVPCYINEANVDKPLLTIFTCQDVHPGEELCFSYFGEMVDDEEIEKDKSRNSNDAVYIPCQCGTKKCRGRMWT